MSGGFDAKGLHELAVTVDYSKEEVPVEKNDFAKFIRDVCKERNKKHGTEISTRKLAEMLGIKYEMFRKILNREKPTKKRDFIIALGVVLHMSHWQVDEALNLYQYMPSLDDQIPRESFIKAMLDKDVSFTISEMNTLLADVGFSELDIYDGRQEKKEGVFDIKRPYKVLENKVKTMISAEYCYGDQYNSLCTTYDPYRCKSVGDMILSDVRSGKIVRLVSRTDGYMSAQSYDTDMLPIEFKSVSETGEYKEYFAELKNAVYKERRRLLDILNDTKNYRRRVSAKLISDSVRVFAEEFNFIIPEMNEYYVLVYASGEYKLYVYERSMFMAYYLSKDAYDSFYGSNDVKEKEVYESLEQLEDLMKGVNGNSEEGIRFRMRKNAFIKMKSDVDELYRKIKSREEFIQNRAYIFDNSYDVLRYYKLEDAFGCVYDEFGDITDSKVEVEFLVQDGTSVTVTLEDIFRAFELGFDGIDEICRIKHKYGSIEAVL